MVFSWERYTLLNEHECRAFLQVAKDGSFSKAAKHLYVSQPSLSQCIKRIELELNTTLIDRSSTPLVLTDAGKIFLEEVKKVQLIRENIIQKIADFSNLNKGHVLVGSSHTRSAWLMSQILPKFFQNYPGIKVDVIDHSTVELVDYARNGEVDFALIYEPLNDKMLKFVPVTDERVLLAVPLNHFLAIKYKGKKKISFKELHGVPVVTLQKTRKMRYIFDELCERTSTVPDVVFEANSIILAAELTINEVGPTLITDTMLQGKKYRDFLVCFELEEPVEPRRLVAAYNCHKPLSNAAQKFIEELIKNKQ